MIIDKELKYKIQKDMTDFINLMEETQEREEKTCGLIFFHQLCPSYDCSKFIVKKRYKS